MKARVKGSTGPFVTPTAYYPKEGEVSIGGVLYDESVVEWESPLTDWQTVRVKAAIAAMHAIINYYGPEYPQPQETAQKAIECADALVEGLRKSVGSQISKGDAPP